MTWQLRRAHPSDIDAIMEIERSTFPTDGWSAEGMASELANAQTYYLVAHRPEFPSVIEGYAGLFAPRGAQQSDIQTIAVTASARRTGLGRVLMQTLIGEARERGAQQVFLEVRADNPGAQRLYHDLGFERIAVRAAYYRPDGVDAIVMRLAIQPARTAFT